MFYVEAVEARRVKCQENCEVIVDRRDCDTEAARKAALEEFVAAGHMTIRVSGSNWTFRQYHHKFTEGWRIANVPLLPWESI